MATTRLLRSTVFRLTCLAVLVLGGAAAITVLLVGWHANSAFTEATENAIEADAAELRRTLATGGFDALAAAVDVRSRGSGPGLYFLADASGVRRAGNLADVPEAFRGGRRFGTFRYQPVAVAEPRMRTAAGILVGPDGGTLVVARDVEEQRVLLSAIERDLGLGLGALALLGISGGLLLARYILGRIDAMARASQAIMAGDLSGRIPRAGSDDELDRLADHLNAMLERIERLMSGLREVSDNIAHDLKTPLNRLRNRAESALADQRGATAWRGGLESVIEEADELIKIFNALLLIARLEAGALDESLEAIDLADVVRDVAELYEPFAEDGGFRVIVDAARPARVQGNRQLIGQAVANLIDNAVKYAASPGRPDADRSVTVRVCRADHMAEIVVTDRGPGIPEADRQRALGRFVRLDASRTRPGTGLGLSLVAAVAQMHRGSVRLEDNRPGLRVTLSLPALEPPAEPVGQASALGLPTTVEARS
jgi:signal transduction histidine kinase